MYGNLARCGFGFSRFYGFGGMIMGIIFVIIILAAVFYFLKIATKDKEKGKSSGLEILEERFAKGEISREEFEGMKKTLIK